LETQGNFTQEGDAKAGQPEAVREQGQNMQKRMIAMRMGQSTSAGSDK